MKHGGLGLGLGFAHTEKKLDGHTPSQPFPNPPTPALSPSPPPYSLSVIDSGCRLLRVELLEPHQRAPRDRILFAAVFALPSVAKTYAVLDKFCGLNYSTVTHALP